MNWFTALNGQVTRAMSPEEIEERYFPPGKIHRWLGVPYRLEITTTRERFDNRMARYKADHAKGYWSAKSDCVKIIVGQGHTPEEAIRDFETKMRLP